VHGEYLRRILEKSNPGVVRDKFVWSPENSRLLCSHIVAHGQSIKEIQQFPVFAALTKS